MLKSYHFKTMVSIDGGKWIECDSGHTNLCEEKSYSELELVTDFSFQDMCDWLTEHCIHHIYYEPTLFRKRPRIAIAYSWNCVEKYTNFKTISIKDVFEERQIRMDDLKYEDAEKVIQYFKERGMNTCPMITPQND